MNENEAFFRTPPTGSGNEARVHRMLRQEGWSPATDESSGAACALLLSFLQDQASHDLESLLPRAQELIDRPSPFLPEPAVLDVGGKDALRLDPERELVWVDPKRIFPNRLFEDRGDWMTGDVQTMTRRDEPALGLAEFARRIARERGDLAGLTCLLGPEGEAAHVDLDGWDTPLGAIFRVNLNGNHRAAAFTVLGAPCIPAKVRWHYGPFRASSSTNLADEEVRQAYRTLLHSYGVASYPDPQTIAIHSDRIFSDWPILIDTAETAAKSLALVEQIAGRRYWDSLGRLPRKLFDAPEALLAEGRRTQKLLDDNRRRMEARSGSAQRRTFLTSPSARIKRFASSGN